MMKERILGKKNEEKESFFSYSQQSSAETLLQISSVFRQSFVIWFVSEDALSSLLCSS